MDWLIYSDVGTIIAIVATQAMAQVVAMALAAHFEPTSRHDWHVGDTLPLWHE